MMGYLLDGAGYLACGAFVSRYWYAHFRAKYIDGWVGRDHYFDGGYRRELRDRTPVQKFEQIDRGDLIFCSFLVWLFWFPVVTALGLFLV